jgi:hypothetical protein
MFIEAVVIYYMERIIYRDTGRIIKRPTLSRPEKYVEGFRNAHQHILDDPEFKKSVEIAENALKVKHVSNER